MLVPNAFVAFKDV